MDGQALTYSDVTMLVGGVVSIITLWWRVETRMSAGAKEALAKAMQVEKDFADFKEKAFNAFKLEVAENYAKRTFIHEVEKRLIDRFDDIVAELHGVRQDLQKAVVEMAKSSSRRRT